MSTNVAFGDRVRRLRVSRDMGQTDFAEALGLAGNSYISKVENGRVPIDEELAPHMARVLDCATEYLFRPVFEISATRPWLRAYADAPAKTVEALVADNATAMEAIHRARLKIRPDISPTFDGDPNDDDAIDHFAMEVRAAAGIHEGAVVGNAMRAAERLGFIMLPMDSELGRHLGFSQRVNGTAVIRISRPSADTATTVPGDRQRFTIAHEIGHVTLHGNCPPPEDARAAQAIEKQAHRFAGAFLAPGDALVADWESLGARTTLTTLSHLKSKWGIAIKALVIRLQGLGIVDAEQARSLYKQISARGWNKSEPVAVSNESAIWMDRALRRKMGDDYLAAAARAEGLGVAYYEAWTDWSPKPVSRHAEVVPLRRPTQTSSVFSGPVGDVVQLGNRNGC